MADQTMAVEPRRSDPRTYDYSDPTRYGDIVMKGGITSGVIYPYAVCEIAKTYRFRNIGGTSAGAIGSVFAAAAEYGRHSATGGFKRLAELPMWLGSKQNLFRLFQPQKRTRALYRLFTAPMGARGSAPLNLLSAAMSGWWPWALLGLLVGSIPAWLSLLANGTARGILIGVGIVLVLPAVLGFTIWSILRSATRDIPANHFGLCTGMPGPNASRDALMPWLARTIEELAGRDPLGRAPLTFGDLWSGPDGADPVEPDANWLNLQMVTTSLTYGRPYRLPFDGEEWYFHPDELKDYFPPHVIKWMEEHSPSLETEPVKRKRQLLNRKLMEPLLPVPPRDQFPVAVAARMSLSFPLLVSAVPLHAIDWSRNANAAASSAWASWQDEHEEDWHEVLSDPERRMHALDQVGRPPEPAVCWFSDGGITSNFPLHFFDAPIPRWPTFAINLRKFHPDHLPTCDSCQSAEPCDQHEAIFIPTRNEGGLTEWRTEIAQSGFGALVGFGHAIIDTMQNWSDNTQLRVPGYRDRVAHVSHTAKEGGMNLDMPKCLIDALTERGRCAGEELVRRFSLPKPDGVVLGWDNQRWVRYRSTMALLQDWLTRFRRTFTASDTGDPLWPPVGERSYGQLLAEAKDHAPSYQLRTNQPFVATATEQLLDLIAEWDEKVDFERPTYPKPPPEIRVRPRV
jgi:hypothetical protein